MEAEELEQLNPAIKGKRLKVVDEVRHETRNDGAAAAPAFVNGRCIHRPKAAFHSSSTRTAACVRAVCHAHRKGKSNRHAVSFHVTQHRLECDRPKVSGSTSSISKLPAQELSHCTTESLERSRISPIFPVTGRAR